jgi:NAD(P)-dependent dehydrogenase (short-subunit alcohol dehydrogenase family)
MTTAIVTGGAHGLGEAICLELATRRVAVFVADRDGAGASRVAEACKSRGTDAHPIEIDLAAGDGPRRMVETAADALGNIDILVNNAGYGTVEPFFEMTAAAWDRTLALNVRAVALAVAAAGQHMKRHGRGGRIVNITSPASRMALPDYLAYAASKAAVDSITRAAALALAPHGIAVNSVAPGMMDTELQQRTETLMARIAGREHDLPAFIDERTRRIPLGRRTSPAEIAGLVAWLALDASPYITAERLNASGGLDRD